MGYYNNNYAKLEYWSLFLIFTASFCSGLTNPQDVVAMNTLYVSLGYPPLPGWILVGGDPCGEAWLGIECVFSNITAIKLSGANLGGELGNSLQLLGSVMHIDFSNNHIAGIIPPVLPPTLTNLSLSSNLFNGFIPDTLVILSQLMELSLDNNRLVGPIPDSFLQLSSLAHLDFSNNNLSGQLPPSMGGLMSLSTLHLQNNQLIGVLDVLQDLPLQDLDIENNFFSGPIPPKLLTVPVFMKDGNPFNTTAILTPQAAPSQPPMGAESPEGGVSWPRNGGPSNQITMMPGTGKSKSFFSGKVILWIAVAGASIIIMLLLCLLLPRLCRSKRRNDLLPKENPAIIKTSTEHRRLDNHSLPTSNRTETVPKETIVIPPPPVPAPQRVNSIPPPPAPGPQRGNTRTGVALKPNDGRASRVRSAQSSMSMKDTEIDMTDTDDDFLMIPPPPPPAFSSEHVTVNPVPPAIATSSGRHSRSQSLNSLKTFSVASLQQYTNSFSRENFIGSGTLGSVYMAELPGGELLAVKKLDNTVAKQQSDDEFLEMVSNISKLRHANIVEIVGYCVEHGQRLLVYKCCINGTLHDALHTDEELHQKLSWSTRIHLALGAACALEYLHEVCKPPVVHRNFNSSNLLLDDELNVHVSDCGLASLLSSASVTQISGRVNSHGYNAPEFELGSYTYQSDVYSFGIVLLELLTGRKAHDSSRPRGEQSLVRWAIPRLHDIDALSRMVDPSLQAAYSMKSLSRFADIISSCIQRDPEFRPPISEIIRELKQMA